MFCKRKGDDKRPIQTERFSIVYRKTKTKDTNKPLWPITKDTDNPVNQSKLEANTCSRYEARENVHERVTIGFVLLLIGKESGVSDAIFFSQSLSVVNAKLN